MFYMHSFFRHLRLIYIASGILLWASCFLLLPSCSFNPNYQGKGRNYVQGTWQQDSVERQKLLVSYSLNTFRFSCDSFYVRIASTSKVNYGSDTCMNAGHWQEYAKGTYTQKGDTLHLNGFYCNPDYTLKKEGGCFSFGAYDEQFKVKLKGDSGLSLLSFSNSIPVNLRLLKRTTCVAKPL